MGDVIGRRHQHRRQAPGTGAFDVLGDPVRRRVLELLTERENSSGDIVAVIQREFGISQSAVSQHLKVLKDAGLVSERAVGTRRVYRLNPTAVAALRDQLDTFWQRALASYVDVAGQATEESP